MCNLCNHYPPHNIKMGSERIMGIYVGYESPSIIKYLELSIGDKLSFWWIKFSNIRGRYKEAGK